MYSICSQNTTILDGRGTFVSMTCFGQYIGHLQVVLNLKGTYTIYRISRPIRCTVLSSFKIFEKNNDECILILVIYWKKTGLLHTKISNHNIIYSSQKLRKLSSLPLKSFSWLLSLDAGTGIYKFGNNTYPWCIICRSNLGHIFLGKKVRLMGQEIQYVECLGDEISLTMVGGYE